MTTRPIGHGFEQSAENIEWLKAEFLRLHKRYLDGVDALNKLAAVASMLKSEGVALPETVPVVIIAEPS